MPVQPNLLYEESELSQYLAGAYHPLVEARRAKTVRHIQVGGCNYFLGEDVIDWMIEKGGVVPEAKAKGRSKPRVSADSSPAASDDSAE